MNYDDETLMAYVDGEVDAKLRTDIDAAIANDPALARRVEHQRAVRAKVAGAFAKVLDQPLPDRLMRAARGSAAPESSPGPDQKRSEEHTSELQSRRDLVCRLLLEKKNKI